MNKHTLRRFSYHHLTDTSGLKNRKSQILQKMRIKITKRTLENLGNLKNNNFIIPKF